MKILGLEFSSTRRSAAVVDARGMLLGLAAQDGGRSAISLVEEALARAGAEREDIEVLAIGLGPGSYTGIRGAIALAQGWQIGRGVRTLGIGSVECLAAEAQRAGICGGLNIVIDAQRNEFYLARYELEAQEQRVIEPLRLASAAEIAALAECEKLVGPEIATKFPGGIDLYPSAATLGRLAAGRMDFVPAERLEPIYLREATFVKAPPPRVIPDRSSAP